MSLLKPVLLDGGAQRILQPGDLLGGGEAIDATLVTVGAGTITAALLAKGIIQRGGAQVGAFSDTTDTAANIIAALASSANGNAVQNGTTFRFLYVNLATGGFTATILAGTNVTVSGIATIATASWAENLVTVTNGTPGSIQTGATVNGSAVVTGMSQAATNALAVGQAVSGTGIAGGTTILSIQAGTGVTLSANATATNNPVALTFAPTVTITRLRGGSN